MARQEIVQAQTGDEIDFIDDVWLDRCVATVVEVTAEKITATYGGRSIEFNPGCLRRRAGRIEAMDHMLSNYLLS